jgi:tetratricopeptide (TPR) repeat protein
MLAETNAKTKVWEETIHIPTYGIGKPNKNPMFLEKRVYQGSTGKVYPHPVVEKIEDEKKPMPYQMVILENQYLHIEIMPELGGRIYRAVDLTNNYDFVYYNQVIKPALVGLAGPWISGGIEFNWPQHHRPNTYGPVEYKLEERADGSATVWVSEIDRMYGTKVTAGFTLHPNKAYLEISAQLYNRTPEPQTFLWWANPAVAVNDHTQSVFPPDVTAVFDHGKRDVSRFPIATGTYYKMDYSSGVDISRYKNIPVPTSYMAYKSDYNFVGGYDHHVQAGLLHVANHHISPGKKQWTWGNGEFGQAWDRNLTDEDGPYIELMTGVFTDNQPDFTWLQPYEEKTFTQYFMPYKNIGMVKNASTEAAVNLEVDRGQGIANVHAYATARYENAVIELCGPGGKLLSRTVTLTPAETFAAQVNITAAVLEHQLELTVKDASGNLLISYAPQPKDIEQVPDAAKPLPDPSEIATIEELYLAGLHLEQYRHATFEPEAYYLEGLKRDENDSRINVAYGTLLLRRGLFAKSEVYFRRAVKRVTMRNPNPYDGEAYYQLGLSLKLQGRLDEAFATFYKAVWSAAWQDSGYFSLAQIAAERGNYAEALELTERSLIRNARNYKSRNLKSAMLRKLDRLAEAEAFAEETIKLDAADFGSHYELALIREKTGKPGDSMIMLDQLNALMRGAPRNYLELASDYTAAGQYEEAADILKLLPASNDPLVQYTLGFLYAKLGNEASSQRYLHAGEKALPDYCFPNSLFELQILEYVISVNGNDAKANYYLGNLLYDKKRHHEAIRYWEKSRSIDDSYSVVHRNLALAYYNKQGDAASAGTSLKIALQCDPNDARVLFELDQLYKKVGVPASERLDHLNKHAALVGERDDLYVEYVTLHNRLGKHNDAIDLLAARHFHPWEGGEGKVTGQYVLAHVELAKQHIGEGSYEKATELLQAALVYPQNLAEGKLAGAQENNIYYYLGYAFEGLGQQAKAEECFRIASQGLEEPASAMYYNDQPPEMIFYQGLAWQKLNNSDEAKRRFNKLVDYAEKHLFDDVKIDYFAVSLPDFLVFDEDLNKKNNIHCRFMRGLGLLGLGHHKAAEAEFNEALTLDCNHMGAYVHLQLNK